MKIERLLEEIRHAALAAGVFVALINAMNIDAQGGGTITGTVTTKASAQRPLRVTMDQQVCGNELPDETIVTDGAGHVANAIVVVNGAKAKEGASGVPAGSHGIMNEKCRFAPRVQIVRPNAIITTSSKDPILHTLNAQIDGGKTLFNVGLPMPGVNVKKPVGGAGLVRLSCNTHPWMRGWVLVTNDLSAVTASDGRFTLHDVPTGSYELRLWHESLKAGAQKVTVTAGQTTTVNFTLQ